jgi:hypothetical protein
LVTRQSTRSPSLGCAYSTKPATNSSHVSMIYARRRRRGRRRNGFGGVVDNLVFPFVSALSTRTTTARSTGHVIGRMIRSRICSVSMLKSRRSLTIR